MLCCVHSWLLVDVNDDDYKDNEEVDSEVVVVVTVDDVDNYDDVDGELNDIATTDGAIDTVDDDDNDDADDDVVNVDDNDDNDVEVNVAAVEVGADVDDNVHGGSDMGDEDDCSWASFNVSPKKEMKFTSEKVYSPVLDREYRHDKQLTLASYYILPLC